MALVEVVFLALRRVEYDVALRGVVFLALWRREQVMIRFTVDKGEGTEVFQDSRSDVFDMEEMVQSDCMGA